MTRIKMIVAALIAAFFLAAPVASANVVRNGSTFTEVDHPCSCWSTIDGYQFTGIPYSPYIRDVFLKLPASTPTAVDIWWELRSDPNYLSLPAVTSGSVESTVSGTVDEDPPADDEEAPARSSWG